MTAVDISPASSPLRNDVTRLFRRKRIVSFAVPLVILSYFAYVFVAFDVPGLMDRARFDNVRILLSDFVSHKTHVTRDNRTGETSVAIEGEVKGRYPDGTSPDWVTLGDDVRIDLGEGHVVVFLSDGSAAYDIPDYGTVVITPDESRKLQLTLPTDTPPDWMSVSDTRVNITTDQGRFSFTRNRTEVFKYSYGWELFFFTLDSPLYGMSFGELAGLAVSGDRIDPARSNIGLIVSEFWTNSMWRHGDVFWAILETILMAFLGTMGAAIVAFPLGFLAASNFSPSLIVRFGCRRLFDFFRGVDGLIWTIILSRAFGPGPLTGSLAILITDTGSFGKMFSEALENVDDRQIDGVRSTGANSIQRARFGVIPQVTPVLLSQILYYLESNTRSATVIGAIVGGGIGLLLTQAISTQKDWEEVSYYIVLIVLMVIAMDTLSGWLRTKLIKGDEGGH